MSQLFDGQQFTGQQFNGQMFLGGADTEDICSRPMYAESKDIELIFGRSNVRKWADVENTESAYEIDQRICWALSEARAYIDDRLRGGRYTIPFTDPPTRIVSMSARYAGVLLYDSRGITDMSEDGKPKHQLSAHRDMVEKFLDQILSGKIRLDTDSDAITYPQVVKRR
jgi:phage gp36-like protein